MRFLSETIIFRGYVSFREGIAKKEAYGMFESPEGKKPGEL